MKKIPRYCIVCNSEFLPFKQDHQACSYECGYKFQNNKKKRTKINQNFCYRCGASLAHKRIHAIYCSKKCKSMDHNFKHRAKTRTVSVARRRLIFERDNSQCYMCKKKLDFTSFELDHLVPVSRGGDSSPDNLAVSCVTCNRSKGSKIELTQLAKLFELRIYDNE